MVVILAYDLADGVIPFLREIQGIIFIVLYIPFASLKAQTRDE